MAKSPKLRLLDGLEDGEDLVGEEGGELVLALYGPASYMGREERAGTVEEVAEVGGEGVEVETVFAHILVLVDVEGGTEDLALLHLGGEVAGFDDGATGGVDDVEGLGEGVEEGGVDHIAGVVGEGDMEREDVGLGLELLEGDLTHMAETLEIGTGVGGEVLVVGDDVAFEALEPLGEGGTHVAEADDADGLAFDLEATVGFAPPESLPHLVVGGGDLVEEGEEEGGGVLADGVAVAFGGVDAADAAALGIVDVDGLHAGTYTSDDFAAGAYMVDEVAVDGDLAAHDEGVAGGHEGEELVVGEVGADEGVDAGLLELGGEDGMGVVGDDCFHGLRVVRMVALEVETAPKMPRPPWTLLWMRVGSVKKELRPSSDWAMAVLR